MKNIFPFILFFALYAGILGCTRNDAQIDFEKEAYREPNNFTRTAYNGEVLNADEDDWRIAPLFQGMVVVNPPFPNPVPVNENLQFELEINSTQAINGLEVLVRIDDMNSTSGFKSLYYETQTLNPGLTSFRINPLELGRINVPESARGLHRIFIFDGNQHMISYGDVMVE